MATSRQSANTCSTCRSRKVRCDGRKGSCGNCERLKLSCSYDLRSVDSNTRAPAIRRLRAHAACLTCHARRIRCNEAKPTCHRCSRLGLGCSYPGPRDHYAAVEAPTVSFGITSSDAGVNKGASMDVDVSQELAVLAFRVFFEKLHRIPVFAFLHRACVTEQYRNGLLDRALLLSLIGITSLLDDLGEGTKELGESLIAKAATMVVNDIERPTVPRIQALILIVKHRALTKRFASVFMLSSIAVRFATGLRLNYEDTQLNFLARESCRRTMWSLYLVDSTLAAGYQDFALSLSGMIHIKFPCHERNFDLDLPPEDGINSEGDSPMALILRLAQLRHRTLHFAKQAVERQTPMNDIVEGIRSCQRDLDTFLESLPPAYQISKHNIMLHAYSSTISVFVSLHATWHGIVCILHRLVLDGLVESLPLEVIGELEPIFREASERRCLESPKDVTDMLQTVQSAHVESIPLDLDIAVCIYQCLRVMIRSHHTLPSDEHDNVESVTRRCGIGLRFLQSMFARTPTINTIIQDTESLIKEELHSQTTDAQQASRPEVETSIRRLRSRHVLSKHSLIGQLDMPSKGDSFLLSPSTAEFQTETSPAFDQEGLNLNSVVVDTAVGEIREPPDAHHMSNITASEDAMDDWEHQEIDASLYQLPDLGLPDFGLDSSIFLPSDWMRGMPSEF